MAVDMNQVYLEVINNINDGVYFVDLDRKIQFWNNAAERITGYSAEEIVGRMCQDNILSHIDEDGTPLCQVGCPLFASNIDGKQRKGRVYVRHKDGYRIPLQVNIFPIRDEEKVVGSIEVFTQDTPTKYKDELVEKLSGNAMHDPLTRLPNRRYLESFLNYKLAEYKRFRKLFAVMFSDIDHFRDFNNTYGHEAGDQVLKNIARSMRESVEKDDLGGRWGGEEFVTILTLNSEYEAPIKAERFRQLVSNTEITLEGEKLHVTVSVGVTVVRDEDSVRSIVERADHLMYQSKEGGRNRVSAD